MFNKYRANKIKIKIAQLEGQTKTLESLVRSGNTVPMYYCDDLIQINGKISKLKMKLELLGG